MNTNERRLFDERLQIQQSPSPMHLIRTLLIGLIVSQAASALGAESEAGARRVMTLEDCVQSALEHNLGLQIARYNPLIARYTLNAIYGGYDPAFSLSGEHDYSLSPGGVDAQGRPFQGTESESDRLSSGFQGTLPWGLFYNVGGSLVDRVDTRTVTIANPGRPRPTLPTSSTTPSPARRSSTSSPITIPSRSALLSRTPRETSASCNCASPS